MTFTPGELTVKVELSDELRALINEAVATIQASSRRLAPKSCSGLEWSRRISWVFNHYVNDRAGESDFGAMSVMGGFLFNFQGTEHVTPMEAMRRDDLEAFTHLCERFIENTTGSKREYGSEKDVVGPATLSRPPEEP